LLVHGLDGLRVVDASMMPGPTPTPPSIMIAEKGAAMVKGTAAKTGGGALGAALTGRHHVIGKRRRPTRVRSATTMLRVISLSRMT
jgi:hypothetical protein